MKHSGEILPEEGAPRVVYVLHEEWFHPTLQGIDCEIVLFQEKKRGKKTELFLGSQVKTGFMWFFVHKPPP